MKTKLPIMLMIAFLLCLTGCKSEVDKCVDAHMDYYYEGQSKKVKSPEPTQLGQAKPPKEGYLTAEQAGYPTPLPEQKSAPPIENTPARAKAVSYEICLEAQAGKK